MSWSRCRASTRFGHCPTYCSHRTWQDTGHTSTSVGLKSWQTTAAPSPPGSRSAIRSTRRPGSEGRLTRSRSAVAIAPSRAETRPHALAMLARTACWQSGELSYPGSPIGCQGLPGKFIALCGGLDGFGGSLKSGGAGIPRINSYPASAPIMSPEHYSFCPTAAEARRPRL